MRQEQQQRLHPPRPSIDKVTIKYKHSLRARLTSEGKQLQNIMVLSMRITDDDDLLYIRARRASHQGFLLFQHSRRPRQQHLHRRRGEYFRNPPRHRAMRIRFHRLREFINPRLRYRRRNLEHGELKKAVISKTSPHALSPRAPSSSPSPRASSSSSSPPSPSPSRTRFNGLRARERPANDATGDRRVAQ